MITKAHKTPQKLDVGDFGFVCLNMSTSRLTALEHRALRPTPTYEPWNGEAARGEWPNGSGDGIKPHIATPGA